MSILSGYGKFKRYILTDSGYKLCSQWTSSNTVHFDDGNTAQTKLGAISGITDSLTATSSNVALSANAGNNLQSQINELNTGIVDINNAIYGVILWKNPNPAVEFPAGTGVLNDFVNNYDYLEIVWCMTAENPNLRFTTGKINNTDFSIRFTGEYLYNRSISLTNKKVSFDDCKYRTSLGGALSTTNRVIIPYQIIGYKKVEINPIASVHPSTTSSGSFGFVGEVIKTEGIEAGDEYTYVAEYNCWIFVIFRTLNGNISSVRIDDKGVFLLSAIGDTVAASNLLPVKKGQTVSVYSNGDYADFYVYKMLANSGGDDGMDISKNAFVFAEGHLYTSATFQKMNNVVCARITAAVSSYAQNKSNLVGTITDSEYIPKQEMRIPCSAQSGTGEHGLGYLIIGTNGEVAYVPITGNFLNWINAMITYFL